MPAPLRNRFTLPFADDLHSSLPRIGKSGRCIRSLLRKNIAWSLSNGTYDRLTAHGAVGRSAVRESFIIKWQNEPKFNPKQ